MTTVAWHERIGNQRDWVWRGWQIRYTYIKSQQPNTTEAPLIFLHGFGACIEHWRYNIPVLSQTHSIYALDLLGFGGSRKAKTEYSISLWVEQLHDFWCRFINKPVVLVGNSIGSLVCSLAAFTYPEMAKGLVMLSLPDVTIRQEMLPSWLQPLVTGIENFVASPPLLKSLFLVLRKPQVVKRWANVAYHNDKAITEELVEILARPAQDEGAADTFLALFQGVRRPNFCPPAKTILPALKIPILLIWGNKDRMVPPVLGPIFAELNPQIKLIELENVGHCPHDECPEQFNQILLSWLQTEF